MEIETESYFYPPNKGGYPRQFNPTGRWYYDNAIGKIYVEHKYWFSKDWVSED